MNQSQQIRTATVRLPEGRKVRMGLEPGAEIWIVGLSLKTEKKILKTGGREN